MITSASNPRLKLVRKLASGRQRAKLGLFVCEGEDLVSAGLTAGIRPVEALVDAERPVELDGLEDHEEVEPGLFAELSSLAHPPRIVAVFRRADLPRELAAPTGLARELRAMFVLALPLVLTQLLQILVHTTEVVMLGWLDARALAAASLAAALLHSGMMFGVGIASATAPLVAQAKGGRQHILGGEILLQRPECPEGIPEEQTIGSTEHPGIDEVVGSDAGVEAGELMRQADPVHHLVRLQHLLRVPAREQTAVGHPGKAMDGVGLPESEGERMDPCRLDHGKHPAGLDIEAPPVRPGPVDDEAAEQPEGDTAIDGHPGHVPQEGRLGWRARAHPPPEFARQPLVTRHRSQVEVQAGVEERCRVRSLHPGPEVLPPRGQRLAPSPVSRQA